DHASSAKVVEKVMPQSSRRVSEAVGVIASFRRQQQTNRLNRGGTQDDRAGRNLMPLPSQAIDEDDTASPSRMLQNDPAGNAGGAKSQFLAITLKKSGTGAGMGGEA